MMRTFPSSPTDPYWSTPDGKKVQTDITGWYTSQHPGLQSVPWATILAAIVQFLQMLIPFLPNVPPAPTP